MNKDGTEDLRIRRTKRAIRESLFELMEAKGFEHISVKDITDGAMISRNTFYLHYSDKYDLLDKICDEMMRSLFFRIGKQVRRVQKTQATIENVAEIILHGIRAVESEREAYRILFSSSSADILNEKIAGVVNRMIDLCEMEVGEIDRLSRTYIVSGLIGVTRFYALNKIDNIEEKCKLFTALHLGKIIELLNSREY